MALSGSLISLKDPNVSGQSYQPVLLCEFIFLDSSTLNASTHPLNAAEGGNGYNGVEYLARIDQQDISAIQARSQQGIDRISDVTIRLFNADGFVYDNYEIAPGRGFKGATLKMVLVLADIDPATGNYIFSNDSPAPVKFTGICDAASCDNGGQTLSVRATTSHNLARVVFPNIPCQQRCVNPFPATPEQRKAGASDLGSFFFFCGYCPDQEAVDPITGLSAKRGNQGAPNQDDPSKIPGLKLTDGAGNYLSCNHTKPDCQLRGMWDKDSAGRKTRRYTGVQFAPKSTYNRSVKYGSGSVPVFSNRNDAIYQRNYPYVGGQQWVKQPLICNVLGDANSVRMEVVVDCGDIGDYVDASGQLKTAISMVLVNGVVVPRNETTIGPPGHNIDFGGPLPPRVTSPNGSTEIFRWSLIATGGREGNFTVDAGYNDSAGVAQGDPYGNLAMIEVVVFSELVQGGSVPDVRVLLSGHKIKVPNTANPDDQPHWPFIQNTLPPWLILDLLIEGNYTYHDIDLQSFLDAADWCGLSFGGNAIKYTSLDGTQKTHNRFIAEVALEEKKTGQEVIQALLRSFNAQLLPNSDGLLALVIRRSLADQQPNPISGSNFNQPIKSLHVDGSPGSGYVAYLIDESVIQQDGRGVPKIRGPYTNPTGQTANRLTFPFQDTDNHYQDDSISVVDEEDVARAGGYQPGGQMVPESLPVLGISSFDQGTRVCNTILAETLRMNENRDTRGTRRWDLELTSRVEHLDVGQIVLFQYQSINAPDGLRPLVHLQSGGPIPGILARVEAIRPTTNYERISVTFAMHEDYPYTDAYGQHAAPPASTLSDILGRPPYPWDPYGEQPQSNKIWDLTKWSFQAAQAYPNAADGSPIPTVVVGGVAPVNSFGTVHPPLFAKVQADYSSGGNIPGGRIYVAISAQDSNGKWSPLSRPCVAEMPAGGNTFISPTISWQPGTQAFVVFAGATDQDWCAQIPRGQSDFICTGFLPQIFLDSLQVASVGAPDQLADSLMFQTKLIVHGGDWGDVASAVTINTLTFPAGSATTNQYRGQVLSLYALPIDSTVNVPLMDFLVVNNDATNFQVVPDPLALNVPAGSVFVMRSHWIGSDDGTTMTNANFLNSYSPAGMIPGAEVGYFVRIIAGAGAAQAPRKIIANTATTYTVDPPWAVPPDITSVVIVEEAVWHPSTIARQSATQIKPAPSQIAQVNVQNYAGLSVLVEALVADPGGATSLEFYSPRREMYVWGAQGTRSLST